MKNNKSDILTSTNPLSNRARAEEWIKKRKQDDVIQGKQYKLFCVLYWKNLKINPIIKPFLYLLVLPIAILAYRRITK